MQGISGTLSLSNNGARFSSPTELSIEGRNYSLALDGTVYNTDELNEKIRGFNGSFKPASAGETLLYAYRIWGSGFVRLLNGMFSFAIWDGRELFIARDPMGVKQLFYTFDGKEFSFASVLNSKTFKPRLGKEGVLELLLLGPGRTPGSGIYENVKSLRPGEYGVYSTDRNLVLRLSEYFTFSAAPHEHDFNETAEEVRALLKSSIALQIKTDKRLCSFLSGGLDSSAIAALSGARATFSVDYTDNGKYFAPDAFQPDSDDEYIAIMNGELNSAHRKIMISADELAGALQAAVEARGLPGMADVDSSLLLFCRKVREDADVALSGECADELFGGYPWYRDETRLWEDAFPWSRSVGYRSSFIREEIASAPECEDFARSRYGDAVKEAELVPGAAALENRMRQMFILNVKWFGQTLLERHNRMSAYAGLEARVPFCDHRLAAYAYNIPWEFKNYRGREKGLLREALRGILPEKVLWRKKSPYPKTHNPRYWEIVSGMLREVLNDPNAPLFEIVSRKAVNALLDAGETGERWYGQLMTRPQTAAYFWQINEWMQRNRVTLT